MDTGHYKAVLYGLGGGDWIEVVNKASKESNKI